MTDRTTIAAIRFGYGLPLPKGAPVDPQGMLGLLSVPDKAIRTFPGVSMAEALPLHQAAAEAQEARKASEVTREFYRAALARVRQQGQGAAAAILARGVASPDGFRERLVQFWADHFTVRSKARTHIGIAMAMMDDAIRPNVSGRFADLLKAATLHPAMLFYLDQQMSVGPGSKKAKKGKKGLNENLARELLELHTLGVQGGYSQADVTQMAELLTGLIFRRGEGQDFNPNAAEPGPETVLGQIYEGEGVKPILQALDDLALRPETARHLAWKLAVHFVADDPAEDLIKAMETAYLQSGGALLAVYGALLNHPVSWEAPLTKLRQPFDFLVAALRGLGVEGAEIAQLKPKRLDRLLLDPMGAMGQPMNEAPGPDGWPEDAASWVTPQRLAARITWAMEMPSRLANPLPEPTELAAAVLGDRMGDRLGFALTGAETRRDAVGLVLSSPEFNRR